MPKVIQKLLERADIQVNGDRPWDLQVNDERFWKRVLLYGNIGLGEAYMDGWWDCRAIDEFIYRLLKVVSSRQRRPWRVVVPGALRGVLFNLQSLARAFQVGEHHYDIGNELYRSMLGENMVYSCAWWQGGATTLEEAQLAKLDLVCRKLGLQAGMRVLDIGCGWGSFCLYAARHYGVKCVGLTISREQVHHAHAHLEGLPVEIRLEDYRKCTGTFDRIVSIGMFEHVGPKNYRIFMDVARRCLTEDGLFLLHTIGSNQTSWPVQSWYTRHIFPNGHIPSIAQIARAVEPRFVVEDLHNFGSDYALTLMAWYHNFNQA
ncbi:MAG TPA: cyclopropane fatty acyl phospholipid synthase, partial [Oceanipulchritudo sp.]|nr:cyclopropane fatty acyl phospholipid synthase [Oceanipulchritudo sp.]